MTAISRAWRSLTGATVLLALAGSSARAQTLFFNGNPDYVNALTSEHGTVVDHSMVYNDFVVGGAGWHVTDIFGYFANQSLNSSSAVWEIRSGITPGDGGTLVQSGTSTASLTNTGIFPFGGDYTEQLVDVGGLSFFLSPGTYWLGLSPVGDGAGRAFLETTSGAGGVDAQLDDLGFINSTFFGYDFSDLVSVGQEPEYSVGIKGDLAGGVGVVPEPSTMSLLALGLVGLAGATRRRRTRRA